MSLSFPVSPRKAAALVARMKALDVKEEDLEESFTRGSGNGGQNRNKVSTAVRIFHKPSGEEVKCSVYRTQGLNRYKARAILCERLELKKESGESAKSREILRIKKNKDTKKRKALRKLKTAPVEREWDFPEDE
jgi:protein subunit release factor B